MGSCTSNTSIQNDVVKKRLPHDNQHDQINGDISDSVDNKKIGIDNMKLNDDNRQKQTNTDKNNMNGVLNQQPTKKINEVRKNNKKNIFRDIDIDDDIVHENISKTDKPLTADITTFIVKSLKSHSFFSNLTSEDL